MVDFPAPFKPKSPVIWQLAAVKQMSSTQKSAGSELPAEKNEDFKDFEEYDFEKCSSFIKILPENQFFQRCFLVLHIKLCTFASKDKKFIFRGILKISQRMVCQISFGLLLVLPQEKLPVLLLEDLPNLCLYTADCNESEPFF